MRLIAVLVLALTSVAHAQSAGSWTRSRLSHCERGDPHACAQAAYAYRLGQGAPRNALVALRLYARSWTLQPTRNISLALYEIVRAHRVPRSARGIVDPLCTAGSAYACAASAVLELERARTPHQRDAALGRLAAACTAGAGQACYDLGPETSRWQPVASRKLAN